MEGKTYFMSNELARGVRRETEGITIVTNRRVMSKKE